MTDTLDAANKIAAELLQERRRQIEVEGYDFEFDDVFGQNGGLANAAACYARESTCDNHMRDDGTPVGWPWSEESWKPGTARRMLVKAEALIIAEIERLDRRDGRRNASEGGA